MCVREKERGREGEKGKGRKIRLIGQDLYGRRLC